MTDIHRTIALYSTEDGTCLQEGPVESGTFNAPNGKASSKLSVLWYWKSLHMVPTNQVIPYHGVVMQLY
jgi:hypothetical protein